MEYDIIIIGAGPAGLASAIRLKQLHPTLRLCILEKGSQVGAHILSGAVLETRALDELLPDWKERNPPAMTPTSHDRFLLLTKRFAIPLVVPPVMRNHNNFII